MSIQTIYAALPDDVKRKVSCHDLKRIADALSETAEREVERLREALKAEDAAWEATVAFDKHASDAHAAGDDKAYWDEFYRLEDLCSKLTENANELRRAALAPAEGVTDKLPIDHELQKLRAEFVPVADVRPLVVALLPIAEASILRLPGYDETIQSAKDFLALHPGLKGVNSLDGVTEGEQHQRNEP